MTSKITLLYEVYGLCEYHARQCPTPQLFAFPLYFRTTCKYNYLLPRFFFHTMVAFFIDLLLIIQGKPAMYKERVKKFHNIQEPYEFFTVTDFFIHTEKANKLLKKITFRDRELFNCDIATVNWESYFVKYPRGLRFYILKESMETLPAGKRHIDYLRRVLTIILVITTVVIYCLGTIFLFRVVPLVGGVVLSFLRNSVC
ncbi:fatty acyl-CoA reductase 1-like [Anthonomus grandis grandis]|uniref:fatty acyl-CoA reductase 1-like n=1 Tax=Anthonomus grandis grandis TaxID=2921223 RepID=UPI0021664349|nr:fatty acyl-CoA reductase 1-like [Anthonomus grandis grandis]